MNMHRIYRPFQTYFRTRRMRQFAELFDLVPSTRVIDVGGDEHNWLLLAPAPDVLLVNLRSPSGQRFATASGDGRHLAYGDRSFDIAYSNSVIEHVGSEADQRAFADEIRRVGTRYYVQTPNRWFLVEPHLIAIGLHLLPPAVARRLVRWLSVWGWVDQPDQAQIDALLASIRLLDKRSLQALFPDAEILEERFLGLTKSLIAVRR
jgi:hypothetical protein